MKPFKHTPILLLLCVMIGIAGCGNSTASTDPTIEPASKSFYVFDTIVQVRIYDQPVTEQNFDDIQGILDTIEIQMNRSNDKSELADVNRNAGVKPVAVSEDTFYVISKALEYSQRSVGRFDLSIGPLVSLWNIGHEGAKVPPKDEIAHALELTNYNNVILNSDRSEIYLAKAGMDLDLGSIAKGFAADKIVDYLQDKGFKSAIIDLGGNVFAMGKKTGDQLWTIGIQDPDESRGNPIGNIHVEHKTIVTSGIYERFFVENGNHYHHILDPETGFPVENNISSVTILTDKSIDADGLSTTLFALGIEKGMEFIENTENADALFITNDKKIYASSGLRELLTLTNDSYTLVEE
ncbi:FAD:protein FMN transferase [Paenibacillus crassostreae]|uniref:FAD:protein FMN transferase n=1 Tax=Paenibacillus crassostreae TaxID=1763538 RepID=A0A162RJK8_9BACL|nr:FAD:protein FMN transferase [Paenibacillus crassostreae]AOZ92459.1 thiamine biosynthesis protein ApbE [Paenibacillus crassostreae]OAB72407.1 thiamine biosynthesis protein ApbE [Paenibacillus crassostreae]